MKLFLTPLLLEILTLSGVVSPAFVLASPSDSKAKAGKYGKLNEVKAKFPKAKVPKSGSSLAYGHGSSMSMSMSMSMTPAPSPAPIDLCGESFTDRLTLSRDLFCQDDGGDEPQECAITLDGPEAELDCNGYKVYQAAPTANSAVNCDAFVNIEYDVDSIKVKQECGLTYIAGICLKNGAKAINCNVEQFFEGILVTDGGDGEVASSDVTSNRVGIFAASNIIISDTNANNNGGQGIIVWGENVEVSVDISNSQISGNGYGQTSPKIPNADFYTVPKVGIAVESVGCDVMINGVTSKDNEGNGIAMKCVEKAVVVMKDTVASNNRGDVGIGTLTAQECNVNFDGVTSNANEGRGIAIGCRKDAYIKMKDIEASNNQGDVGIGLGFVQAVAIVDLEGTITSSENEQVGMAVTTIVDSNVVLNVKGNVNLAKNGGEPAPDSFSSGSGFGVFISGALDIVVEEGGSFQSCGNEDNAFDIEGYVSNLSGTLTWTGDFTCDPDKVQLKGGSQPNCLPCPGAVVN